MVLKASPPSALRLWAPPSLSVFLTSRRRISPPPWGTALWSADLLSDCAVEVDPPRLCGYVCTVSSLGRNVHLGLTWLFWETCWPAVPWLLVGLVLNVVGFGAASGRIPVSVWESAGLRGRELAGGRAGSRRQASGSWAAFLVPSALLCATVQLTLTQPQGSPGTLHTHFHQIGQRTCPWLRGACSGSGPSPSIR